MLKRQPRTRRAKFPVVRNFLVGDRVVKIRGLLVGEKATIVDKFPAEDCIALIVKARLDNPTPNNSLMDRYKALRLLNKWSSACLWRLIDE